MAILGIRGIPAKYGGFETFAEELAVRLVKRGIDVTVYCEKRPFEQLCSYKGVTLAYIKAPSFGPFSRGLYELRCLWAARKADVVYVLGYGSSIFCFLPRLWGNKVWINMDGIEWARAKWDGSIVRLILKVLEAFAMWMPNRIIADAEGIKEFLRKRHVRMPPCSVISYGAEVVDVPPDETILKEFGVEKRRYYLIVCRLEAENHVLEILHGFAASRTPMSLLVVGDHRSGTPYVECLRAIGEHRVHFIGTIYDREKLQALRFHCCAYFHGHSVGGTNPSLLEALACGNVVVAHDNAFNREVAPQAFFFKDAGKDIPVVVKEIESMTGEKRRLLGESDKDRIRTLYSWDKVAGEYLDLLSSLK